MAIRNWKDIPLFKGVTDEQWNDWHWQVEHRLTTVEEIAQVVNLTEKEKEDIIKKLGGKKYDIMRSKGLGENEPDMMWETTMNPETRRLIKVMPDDAEETAKMFDILLGDNLAGRKDYIAEYGPKYLELADIS